jgi:abequosyltransferase
MTAPLLSVCIPVYNCANYLPFALDSILAQCDERVEIIVYDGGSTDSTPQVMASYRQARLQYHRAKSRGGIDADLASCVGYASGEFCWLFSGDDVMRPGALAKALAWVRSGADVIVCRHSICDIDMRFLHEHPVLWPTHEGLIAEFSDAGQRRTWFSKAATTEAFFSFLSGIIVRRRTWDAGDVHPELGKSCWALAARLLSLADRGLRVLYVPEICLDQRGENDSFASAGVVNRYRIAIEGYQLLGNLLFGSGSLEAFHIRRVLRNEFSLEMFLMAKVLCKRNPLRESRSLLDSLYARLHSDPSIRSQCCLWAYRLTPVWVAVMLRSLVRRFRVARESYRSKVQREHT